MHFAAQLMLLSSAAITLADKHHLIVGAYNRPVLFSLEYDTQTNQLRQTNRFAAHSGHPWLSLSHDKQTLYGAEKDGWSSYSVKDGTSLRFQSNITVTGPCPGDTGSSLHGRTSVLAQTKPPYNVIGSAKRACGTVISTNNDGSLNQILQNINYGANSRIHGMVADPNSNYVYSADEKGNGIWVHQVDANTGALVPLSFSAFPVANAAPRRLALSGSSRYLYVLLSKLTKVGVYEVNGPELRYTGMNYTLVPEGANPNFYKGHDILLSADKNILYAASRYRAAYNKLEETDPSYDEQDDDVDSPIEPRSDYRKDNMMERHLQIAESHGMHFSNDTKVNPIRRIKAAGTPPGYVTAIQLMAEDPEPDSPSYGYIGAGWPVDTVLQVPTSTSGGKSNALVPAPWGNEYFAITDSDKGFVQVWKISGLKALVQKKYNQMALSIPGFNMPTFAGQPPVGRLFTKRQDPAAPQGGFLGDVLKAPPSGPDGYQPAGQDPIQQPQGPPQGPPLQDPNGQYQPAGQQSPPPPQYQQVQPPQQGPPPQQDPNAPPQAPPPGYGQDPNAPPQGYAPYPAQGPPPQGQDPTQQNPNNPGLTIVVQAPPQQQGPPPQYGGQNPGAYQPVFGGQQQQPPNYGPPPQPNYPPPPQYQPGPPPRPRPDDDDDDDRRPAPRPVGFSPYAPRLGTIPRFGPPPVVVVPGPPAPVAASGGALPLLTGTLSGIVKPGVLDGVLGTNNGKGLLGGGGLLGLGILKRDQVSAVSPDYTAARAQIRASVIAEWRAPAEEVGVPDEDEVAARRALKSKQRKTAAAAQRRQLQPDFDSFGNPEDEEIDLDDYSDDYELRGTTAGSKGSARVQGRKSYNGDIPAGRGCCANAVWFD